MDEKTEYAILPSKEMEDIFKMLEGMADFMGKTAKDPGQPREVILVAQDCATLLKIKIKELRQKVEIL